jgi:tripartite ATP-independent transporter DctM subunit
MIYLPAILAFALLFLGVPVSISLVAAILVYFAFLTDTMPLTMVVQKMVSANMSYTLLAVPYFLMVGSIMNASGISKRLMAFCDSIVGHKVGGLAQVNVLLSTINGGICGSGAADAAIDCKILVPEMSKRGYPIAFSAAVTAASGLIAPIIPPGVGLILYGIMTETPIGKMFAAGYIPGILMCVAEMATVSIVAHRKHYQPSRGKRASLKEIMLSLKDSVWSLVIPLIIIFGLRGGLFTATEGAVVIIVFCFLVGIFFYRELHLRDMPGILREAFRSTASIIVMILAAVVFGMYLSWARIPQGVTEWMLSFTKSPIVFLLMVNLLLLIFGMFLDGTAILMIMTPLLYPAAQAFGIDVIQFGMMIIINASIGSLTPPVGGLMYVVCKLCNVTMIDFVKHVWPFIIALVVVLVLIMLLPQISTFLPNLIYG